MKANHMVTEHAVPVALITGSSRGIGRGIALALADVGYDIVVNGTDITDDTGAPQTARLIESHGRTAWIVQADISSADDRRRLVDRTLERFGRIDLLVNNAGVAPRQRLDLLEATEESFDRVLGVNLKGPYFLTQRVAREMLRLRQQGLVATPRIVFITSISAHFSSPSRGEYCVSKAGAAMAAMLFADRLAAEGIVVFELRPGIIDTRMVAPVHEKYERLIADGLVPQRRFGVPEDIGRVVAAIGRGDLDFCTGAVIEVGGGIGLRRL